MYIDFSSVEIASYRDRTLKMLLHHETLAPTWFNLNPSEALLIASALLQALSAIEDDANPSH